MSDIDTKTGAAGPLASLGDSYGGTLKDSNTYRYPFDSTDLSHAMMFNIHVSENSKISANEFVSGDTMSRSQQSRDSGKQTLIFQRKTKRITKTIMMYMPETMVYDSAQNWATPSLAPMAADIASSAVGVLTAAATGAVGKMVSAVIGAVKLSSLYDPNSAIGAATQIATGYAANPMIEVLYGSPNLRSFQFDFNFAPSNEMEAKNIRAIIRSFRSYSAPELSDVGPLSGAAFIPPAEWDITFLRKMTNSAYVQNNNIPTISTCVLRSINVNYAPENQWVTHHDGMPVHIQMRLEFLEIDIMDRAKIESGF